MPRLDYKARVRSKKVWNDVEAFASVKCFKISHLLSWSRMMATRESKKKGIFLEEDELMFQAVYVIKGLFYLKAGLEVFAMASTLRPSENRNAAT